MRFKAIWKDTFREINQSKMRFLAILTIILLGVAFYVGISATGPDMIETSDEYFTELELMDYRVQSTYGLTEDDILALNQLENVSIQSHYAHDFLLADASTIRLYSLDPENGQQINQYYVINGRLPEKPGEIAIDHKKYLREGIQIGDTITLETGESAGDPDEYLEQNRFEVVGLVNSPLFIEIEARGVSSIGSGTLNAFGVILAADYTPTIYTDAFIRIDGAKNYTAYSEDYEDHVASYSDPLEQTLDNLALRREQNIQDDIQQELDDGWTEIEKAEQELADAEAELVDARREIDDGWKELAEGKAELQEKTADAQKEIAQNEQQLREGAQELQENKSNLIQQKKELQARLTNLEENEKELRDGIVQLKDGIAQMKAGQQEIDAGLSQIKDGLTQIAEKRAEIQEGFKQLEAAKDTLVQETNNAQRKLNQAEADLNAAEAELEAVAVQFEQGKQKIAESRAQLAAETEAAEATITANEEELLASLEQFGITKEQLGTKTEELQTQKATLIQQEQVLTARIAQIEGNILRLEEQLAQMENDPGKEEVQKQLTELQTEQATVKYQLAEITKGLAEINQGIAGMNELQTGFNAIEEARNTLVENTKVAQQQLDQAETDLKAAEKEFQKNLSAAQARIKQGWQELEKGRKELKEKTVAAQVELTANEQELQTGLEKLNEEETKLNQQKEALEELRASLNEAELQQQLVELEANLTQIEEGKKQIADGLTQINDGLALIEEKEREIQEGVNEIAIAKDTLATETTQAEQELAAAEAELNEAEADYAEGLQAFEEERTDALAEIEEGKEELEKAAANLDKLAMPEYMLFDRTDNFGYSEYKDNADRLSVIARVFPVFFFLIAIFISFTTMTRMVDEEREYIGIMKAMGYKNRYILIKFIVYAAIATIIGASFGLLIGYTLFPKLIFLAYSSLYNFPDIVLQQYTLYSIIALVFAFISTVGASLLAVQYSLRSNAARLLQPKPPKKGSRIWLEKISFIWNRLSFNYKITFRNVFRYKSRMLMTILGIAGSTGLILTGFGISDSVEDIPDIQYGIINQFQAYVALNPNASASDFADYQTVVQEIDSIEDDLFVLQQNVRAEKEGMITQDITFFVPEDPSRMNDFVRLGDYENPEKIYELDNSGVYLTQKIAQLLELNVGDTFDVLNADDEVWTAQVAGIVENYMNHLAYMTPEYYTEMTGEAYEQSDVQLVKYNVEEVDTADLGSRLMDEEAVAGIQYVNEINDAFAGSIESLDLITQILVISAAALAFIVLYNLTNINVSERRRELSTIKVLGSHDYEVTTYIYRENIILTFLGILVGLGFGNILTNFIMATMEVDMLVFGRNIYFSSYLYSSLLTILFSLVVMVVIHFQLKKIDMVEALKGND